MKVFISHSSRDSAYGNALVQLLLDVGISHNNIIYTSLSGFGITKGESIFKWLKNKLVESPFVIYLLSENYYSSIPCLNEMGAAWVIENDHVTFIVPGFDISDKKFSQGAIDPREVVVFADVKEDIIEFLEILIHKSGLQFSYLTIEKAANRYLECLKNFDCDQDSSIEEYNEKRPVNENFEEDVLNDELTEEEILLIGYMSDEGNFILGDRWMAKGEIEQIIKWERSKGLNGKLSNNYSKALSRLITREYLQVHSNTEQGNPREYILNKNISKSIIKLTGVVLEKVSDVKLNNKIAKEDIF